MREERQTGKYLLLASIASIYSAMLVLITLIMSWEVWMIPLIVFGVFGVWCLHIGRIGSEALYENICAGLILVEFFFFGVHSGILFDMPAVACIMILVFSMLDKKSLIYMTLVLYTVQVVYHFLSLHTLIYGVGIRDAMRLLLGIVVTVSAAALARYRINRRMEARVRYESVAEQLETVSRQNADFLSNVSHELRTPINMVIGISEVALEKEISSEVRADIQSIQMAGKRLSGQINNILDYTEIVEGTLTQAKEEYMITSVLNDLITMTAMQSSRQKLEIVFDMNLKMPAVLVGDAEKISHVLKILLENSIKFTEEGGINVCLEFRRESYGINLIIDIYDTGIGMSEAQLAKIYDEFYQADTGSSRFSSGLGLGIPIARGLLHSMDGFIHFESKGHQGLQAHITIPQGVADDTPCMTINNPEKLCIACYFRPDKYSSDEIRRFYDRMILHLMEGLGLEGYQAHNFDGLLKLLRTYKLTHVFITQSEYEENRAYYEELAESLQVVVIAEREYVLSRDSRLLMIRKPFFALSVVNLLNGEVKENGFEEAQNAGRRPFSCVGVHALVVDDEEMNLVVAKGVLGSYGIQVDTSLSGREAVEMCRRTSYDIIFLDHMMPGYDGVETLRRIREINYGTYQDLPVIALTANTISGAREMFRNEGFTEFIPKPIERAVLERVLRRVLPKSNIHYGAEPVAEDSLPQEEEVPFNPFDVLSEVGINAQIGLDYCCGDENFYLEMLRMFHGQSEAKREEIVSLYDMENWPDYAVKVHALKSTSLTIGAEELSEQAKALERAGKKEDIAYIRENHLKLLEMYDDVCRSIAGF
ncbi:MAG: response regulator [Dorea sp.]|nr:response regulator [Dorea sp.]